MVVLLREELGDVLRDARRSQGRTLRDISAKASVSLGYLSEIERGEKEASSELLASICAALEMPMSHVFTEIAQRAAKRMPRGGSLLTLTYGGPTRIMPNYNVMGVAKAGLEASVRYLAVDYGLQKIRVNAISAGPIRTLAGAGINDARYMFAFQQRHSPLGRGVSLEDLGGAGLYLLRSKSVV